MSKVLWLVHGWLWLVGADTVAVGDLGVNFTVFFADASVDEERFDDPPDTKGGPTQEGHGDPVADVSQVVAVASDAAEEDPQDPGDDL